MVIEDKKKLGLTVIGVALLVIVIIMVRDTLLERGRRFDVSPLNPETQRYDCEDGRFLLLHFFSENGQDYVEAAFNDIQQATLTKAETGGRYTVGDGIIELYEVNGAWEAHQRGKLIYSNCRSISGK